MKNAYLAAMDGIYLACMWLAGLALLVMTIVMPIQVVARRFFGTGLSWPEPVALICMIIFTYLGAAAAYRAGAHIAVTMLTDRLPARGQFFATRCVDFLMAVVALFVMYYGAEQVISFIGTGNSLEAFPGVKVYWTYLPLPLGSLATLLFVIEAVLFGKQHHRPVVMIGSHGGSTETEEK